MVSLLRAINVGCRNRIPMDALRKLHESLGLRDVRTYVNSGNVVFGADAREAARIAGTLEDAIERHFGFRTNVIVRTAAEMKSVAAANPFAGRRDVEPNRLLVLFLAGEPARADCEELRRIECAPEEVRSGKREIYIYYANGLAKPGLPWMKVEKILKTPGTGRNWNTVTKLVEMAGQS